MLVSEAKSFRELCRENGIAVTHQHQVALRSDEDDAWPSESGRDLCTREKEDTGDLAGYGLQKRTFAC
jgi:hypothetical protein